MNERPILFSAPMVRAILEGRKTQTRRALKSKHLFHESRFGANPPLEHCPYGQPGDRLWVRETFAHFNAHELFGAGTMPTTVYRAGRPVLRPPPGQPVPFDQWQREWSDGFDLKPKDLPWRPSIYMPRARSRITLEISEVRVERLHEISEADARAEGCPISWDGKPYDPPPPEVDSWQGYGTASFCLLWSKINGAASWDANPWVWALTFKRVTQ